MTSDSLISVWQRRDLSILPDLLADQVTFSSPAADYHGRDDAAHMLGLIPDVLEDIRVTGSWQHNSHETMSAFTVQHRGQDLDGLLREEWDDAGRLTRVTLFLRPYRVLTASMKRMRELMADRPLPSASS